MFKLKHMQPHLPERSADEIRSIMRSPPYSLRDNWVFRKDAGSTTRDTNDGILEVVAKGKHFVSSLVLLVASSPQYDEDFAIGKFSSDTRTNLYVGGLNTRKLSRLYRDNRVMGLYKQRPVIGDLANTSYDFRKYAKACTLRGLVFVELLVGDFVDG